ncbi:PD-(D/E)XK motif protein [Labrys sp. LIt4]|uniref:PD-(D/E)XK motif protein n=1 Tax=Labrys sp. LIt4 TaxID=2821355 RepID=UPI001ADF7659|nr:PD-(D/E)XK motif protein [Labrys sp. LIt4]MBP0579590.1 PD-(D/E)XK motif protein [Labrys sp. LIt4]
MSIGDLWDTLARDRGVGGARRVDAVHACDLYAALDGVGRPGLVLLTHERPPQSPVFEVVAVEIGQRLDERWSTGVWLTEPALRGPFASLCDDVIAALRAIGPGGASGYLLAHLLRWRRLLSGGSGLLDEHELRGLLGEILVLRECLAHWPPATVLLGWAGPMGGHQDVVLPGLRIEVKTIRPGASTTRINSLDQLDVVDTRLLLAVVTLAPSDDVDGRSAARLVDDLRQDLLTREAHGALLELEARLQRGGYDGATGYDERFYRLDGIRYFQVEGDFPRLVRGLTPAGIDEAAYDIELARCHPHLVTLRPDHGD